MTLQNMALPRQGGLIEAFRTLGYRNFRLFFIGNGISLIGSWMQQIALSWLVYRMTNSPFLLGIIAFASLFPGVLLTPLAGVLSDTWDRRLILLVSQVLAMAQAIILAVLVLTDTIAVWHITALSVLLGLISAFDIPTRQSFVVDLIEHREDLGSAIALNSALFNCARLIGPSLAGIIIAIAGEGVCFVFNALSYLPVIATLLLMKVKPAAPTEGRRGILSEFKAGLDYSFGFPPSRYLLLLLGLISMMGSPYTVLMPIFAKDIFHGGPHTLGFLTAASGGGSIIAALYLASKRTVRGIGSLVPLSAGMLGLGLVLFSLSRMLWVSLFLLFFIGLWFMLQLALSNTILQTIVDDDMRGRAMSFFAMTFMATAPVGGLLAGVLADMIGAPLTLIVGGGCCILGALAYARKLTRIRELVSPIYVQKGMG